MKHGGGKTWFTAAELAELRLPGLPGTKRKINERAAGEGWALRTDAAGAPLARPRAARGGGLEYHVDVLPPAARAALAAKGVGAIADVAAAPESAGARAWAWFEAQGSKTKDETRHRLRVIATVEAYEAAGFTRTAAVAETAARYQLGASTLWSWLSAIEGVARADRLPRLAPRRCGGGAEVEVDADVWQLLISDYLRPEKPSFTSCYRRAKAFADDMGVPIPIERTLRRKVERDIDPRLIIARRKGAEALRQVLPPQQRSVADLHALEYVNIDGHKWDVFVRWPDGRVGRPLMVAIQDLYSRKILAWRIDESESALSTRLVFADLFAAYGIPRGCVMDNGRAFASKTITGGAKSRYRFKIKDEEPTGVLVALGIEVRWATPYRGQSKPIERAFRDLCDAIAKHPALAGAYTGNRPDAKPENYGARAVDIEEFRRIVDLGIAEHNAREGRRTETARGRSFDATFAESYATAPIGKASPEQLRLALLTAEDIRCDRQSGAIALEGNRYWTPELGDHAGERVTVRFDPDNLHGEVHVYHRDGRFIATAPVLEATGFFDKASAVARRKQEADLRRTVREIEQKQNLLDAAAIAALLPDHPDEAPIAPPAVIRPVRHRGQTAAALKPVSEADQAPLNNPVIDRLADFTERLRIVR